MSGRILVVDDAPRNRKLLADLLVAEGYDVVAAASGTEALDLVVADPPALVLLDVMMPSMNGYEVCRAIRENPATAMLPVVMVTALEASAERVKGLEAGADDFVSKPVNQPELLARVRSLLRIKRLHDTVEEQAKRLAAWNDELESRVAAQLAALERLARLKRFLPSQVVERVVAGDADDPLESHRREISVVFVGLRGFTAFAETSAPEEVMDVLRDYHAAIGRSVMEFEGTVERFGGEGVTVLFNDPAPQPDDALRAVRMAIALREQSRSLASRWEKRGFELDLAFGVGQGYATLGAIGSAERSDYAAIGTVTNLAFRLCEEAKGGEILVSRKVSAAVDGLVDTEAAGERSLRGFLRPIPAFRIRGTETPRATAVALPATAASDAIFRREGDYWTIAYDGTSFRLKDAKGLRYIAELLRHPDRDFNTLDLVAIARGGPVERVTVAGEPGFATGGLGDAGAMLDAEAKDAYRRRLDELRSELEEAESFQDVGRAPRIREEIEFLSQELARAVGLGGRDRKAGAAAERARVNVTRSISDSVERIREYCQPLARHLDGSIRTGAFCTYRPPDPPTLRWQL